jgi:acetoacetyl-CoA synthetase
VLTRPLPSMLVAMGTADFYAVVEGFAEVADSLVIDTTELGAHDEGELLDPDALAPFVDLARASTR